MLRRGLRQSAETVRSRLLADSPLTRTYKCRHHQRSELQLLRVPSVVGSIPRTHSAALLL